VTAGEFYLRSAAFWERMESVKRGIDGVAWYPYCSLANFEHFAPLLGAEADFAALLGAGPILDIGCADGDLSFFLEDLGIARPIHALDHAGTNHNGLAGIVALKRALGSAVETHDLNLDEGFELPARPYSMAFCLGLLYHVKNPFHLLESLSRYARTCLLSTRIMTGPPDARPAAYLLDPAELNNDETNFWLFNEAGLRRLVARAGWQLERFYSTGPDAKAGDERAFCLLRSRRWLANITLGDGWHEESPEGWRWTERRFSFSLKPGPWRSLTLHIHLPEALFARTEAITITVLGVSYRATEPGIHVLRVPLPTGTVLVECELDRALAPSESDPRELGLVVTEVIYTAA
jgi:tRNA (mo5U34)-methyltransferase